MNKNPEYPQNRPQGAQVDVGIDPNNPTATRFGSGLGSVPHASQIDAKPIASSHSAGPAPRFCAQCGAKRSPSGSFCVECGNKFT